jgi:hypothetical protein
MTIFQSTAAENGFRAGFFQQSKFFRDGREKQIPHRCKTSRADFALSLREISRSAKNHMPYGFSQCRPDCRHVAGAIKRDEAQACAFV